MKVNQPYVPINCGYHDELTALVLSRKKCEIVYKQSTGNEVQAVFNSTTNDRGGSSHSLSACGVSGGSPDLGATEVRVLDTITDVFTRGQEEFLRLASGVEVRLDYLVSVDGKTLSSACSL